MLVHSNSIRSEKWFEVRIMFDCFIIKCINGHVVIKLESTGCPAGYDKIGSAGYVNHR